MKLVAANWKALTKQEQESYKSWRLRKGDCRKAKKKFKGDKNVFFKTAVVAF
jgi:hypothetical protein